MTQAITPELRQWIVAQAQAGHSPEDVLAAMKTAGWNEDVAIAAMEETLTQHLDKSLPAPVPVPDVDVSRSPRWLDAGDRQVEVVMAMQSPRVVVLGGLLSEAECDAATTRSIPHGADRHRRRRGQRRPHQPRHVF